MISGLTKQRSLSLSTPVTKTRIERSTWGGSEPHAAAAPHRLVQLLDERGEFRVEGRDGRGLFSQRRGSVRDDVEHREPPGLR